MSRQPDAAPASHASPEGGTRGDEYSREERALLLQLAHDSIAAALDHRLISTEAPTPHLAEPRGAFTTLYHLGNLRGCVGYILAIESLYRTVAETARAAAFEDTRFWPVAPLELPELRVHLSILSAPAVIAAEDIEVGRHGLLISHSGRRGLLLPQVAVEHGWDRATFLEQTCHKAGLAPNAWRGGAQIEAFTAEVFGDEGGKS